MNNKILIALLVLSSILLPTFAVDIQDSVLNIEASKVNEVIPDTAIIRFYVENSGVNLSDIKEKNDKIVNQAINAIKAKLSNDESVKTVAFSVNNIYSYKDRVRIFQKYEVKNGFEVKLKDLTKISEIVNIAMDNGVKNVGQLTFSLSDSEKECNMVLVDTIKIAKNRANTLAESLGVQLGRVKSVNPYCSVTSNNPSPRFYTNSFTAKSSDASEGSVIDSIKPGTLNIRSSVNMTYYLK